LPNFRTSPIARPHAAAITPRSAGLRRSTRSYLIAALFVAATTLFANSATAQANTATATRQADLQVGGYFVYSPAPDYTPEKFRGGGGYATLDLKTHYGAEINFREVVDPTPNDVSEKTYEIGGRYVRHYGIYHPYIRGSYGRGVFNFPYSSANLAYNLFAIGGGVDIVVRRHINARVDYDYQRWLSFPSHGLTPQLISVGAAYHF
jgi:opacity protein-like surface antigen